MAPWGTCRDCPRRAQEAGCGARSGRTQTIAGVGAFTLIELLVVIAIYWL
jgi:type II secretory pathway pseudopilin PulG